eukprot:TRINITY_DN15533_c1_g1_i4.p2 TRINITY_DN15533_c1_g1~~TRINITY_DN15533_c1_g1_i4.p2  ORF type:complete len:397 (+),score=147.53 TRINITY_DN15533_c1_g1_i4:80-1192(+)
MSTSYHSSVGRPQASLIGGVGLTTAAPGKRLKVAVLGAAGGIGQTLSLMLKIHLPAGSILHMYDVSPAVQGVAADISHVDTQVSVRAFTGDPKVRGDPALQAACKDVDVVTMIAGFPRQPGMTRADLFDKNASVVRNLVEVVAHVAPTCMLCIGTNPVNAVVPLAADILKHKGVYNKDRLFGVTILDNLRACCFLNEALAEQGEWDKTYLPPVKEVPVIGGHSDTTIVPCYSATNGHNLPPEKLAYLYQRTRNGGTEVVKAKAGKGSATLSMGVANAHFVIAICEALLGHRTPTVCAMVDTAGQAEVEFMACPVRVGCNGIEARLSMPPLNATERDLLAQAMPILKKDAEQGSSWIAQQRASLWTPQAKL